VFVPGCEQRVTPTLALTFASGDDVPALENDLLVRFQEQRLYYPRLVHVEDNWLFGSRLNSRLQYLSGVGGRSFTLSTSFTSLGSARLPSVRLIPPCVIVQLTTRRQMIDILRLALLPILNLHFYRRFLLSGCKTQTSHHRYIDESKDENSIATFHFIHLHFSLSNY